MAIFNSYVKLPEGIPPHWLLVIPKRVGSKAPRASFVHRWPGSRPPWCSSFDNPSNSADTDLRRKWSITDLSPCSGEFDTTVGTKLYIRMCICNIPHQTDIYIYIYTLYIYIINMYIYIYMFGND